MNFLPDSMATASTGEAAVEAAVQQILDLRRNGIGSPSDETRRRIETVRALCQAAEATDGNGQVSWRRGTHNHRSTGNSTNRWRGQPNSHKPSSSGTTERSVGRQVSKFSNSETPVEDKILNQVILNKLNKFSIANYNEVKEFLEQILDSDEAEFLRDFMNLVFKKAATEPTFCGLQAKMLSELSVKYTSLLTEFGKLQNKYLGIFEELTEEQCSSQEQFVQRNREKQHRLGQSQFLGELTSLGVLELSQLRELQLTILSQIQKHAMQGESKQMLIEEYVDCLLRMTRAFQKGKSPKLVEVRQKLAESCEPIVEDILARRSSHFPGLSKRGCCSMMDCLDIFRGTAFPA